MPVSESVCKQCQKLTQNPKFCDRSCAATYNNKKRQKTSNTTCTCGKRKYYRSEMCRSCRTAHQEELAKARPIKEMFMTGSARTKYVTIREWARKIADRYLGIDKCQVCGFDVVLEVCHKRDISSFSEHALMGEVNDPENLVVLCPNHHAMFDRGLLDL